MTGLDNPSLWQRLNSFKSLSAYQDQVVYHYSFSRSKYFHLLKAPIEGFITLIG